MTNELLALGLLAAQAAATFGGMAKASKQEAISDWRKAEAKYREVVDAYLTEGSTKRIDKSAAVEIAKARAKADKKFDACLRRLLG